MRSRWVVALLGALLLAGCSEGAGPKSGSPPTTSPATTTPATSPTVSSTESPTVSAEAPDPPPTVTVTIVGDLMLVRGVPDAAAALAPMAPRLRRADLTIGNLESTLSTDGSPTQDDAFGGSPALVGPLRRAGFDAVSLANNHTGDFGERALLQTVDRLAAGPVRAFGAGRTTRAAARPLVLEADGLRFAFLGFNAIGETPMVGRATPGALSVRMPPRTGPLQRGDLRRVTAAVRRADRQVDAVIVLPHWGEQYTHRPEPVQRVVAAALVEAGADLVVGGHPHWVQGVETIRRRLSAGSEGRAGARQATHESVPVLHSLGNFVFDMDFMTETMQGVVLETTWTGQGLTGLRLVPYVMDPASFAPRPAFGEVAADILGDMRSTSTGRLARCLTAPPDAARRGSCDPSAPAGGDR